MHAATKIFLLAAGVSMPCGLAAEGLSIGGKSSGNTYNRYSKLLDGRLAKQYKGSDRLRPGEKHLPRYGGGYNGEYLKMAEDVAATFGIPQDLFKRLIQRESNWNQNAVSPKGAIGLAQLMPETAALLGVDPKDARSNLEGGALYLKKQYVRFRSWKLAVAAYNAGPEAVDRYDDVPPYPETQAYVLAIMGR